MPTGTCSGLTSGLTYWLSFGFYYGFDSFFDIYYFFVSGFWCLKRSYLDSCHDDKEIFLFDIELFNGVLIKSGFSFENNFLALHFEAFELFDFVFNFEDLR